MLKKKIIYIHGGESFENDQYFLDYLNKYELDISKITNKNSKWNRHLDTALGGMFEIIAPQMPNAKNARFQEWEIWFKKIISQIDEEVVLIANSLGATFILQYLSQNTLPVKIEGLFLVAATREAGDMCLPEDLSGVSAQVKKVYIYHSLDDNVVPYSNAQWIHDRIQVSILRTFSNSGHFNVQDIFELYEDIYTVTKTRWSDFSQYGKVFVLPVTGILVDVFFEKIMYSSLTLKEILAREGIYKSQAYLAEHYLNTAGASSSSQFLQAFNNFGFEAKIAQALALEAESIYRKRVLALKPVLQPGIEKFITDTQLAGHKIVVISISSKEEIQYIKKLLGDPKEIVFFSKDGILDIEEIIFESGEEQIAYLQKNYIHPDELVVSFVTAPSDIKRANASNIISIAIPYANDKKVLKQAKPSFVMNNIEDVLNQN